MRRPRAAPAMTSPSSIHPIYPGGSPAEVPAYSIAEAAQWLGMPFSTVRAWTLGQGKFQAVIEIDRASKSLSPLCGELWR